MRCRINELRSEPSNTVLSALFTPGGVFRSLAAWRPQSQSDPGMRPKTKENKPLRDLGGSQFLLY